MAKIIIHIQELNSSQVTEVKAHTIEDGMWAYAHNAAFDWDAFECAKLMRYRGKKMIKWMEFCFAEEYLIIRRVGRRRYTAEWVDM